MRFRGGGSFVFFGGGGGDGGRVAGILDSDDKIFDETVLIFLDFPGTLI